MSYSIVISRRVQKELARLPRTVYQPIRDGIAALGENPRPEGCTKLVARDGWRIRVGKYRVLYDIDDARRLISIVHIGHRKDVYRS